MTGHFVEYFTTALKTVGWKTGGHTVQKNLYETVVDELGWTVKPGKIPPPYHMGLWLAVIVQYGVPNSCSMHIGSQILAVCISVMQLQYVLFASRVPNYMAGRPTSPAEIVNPAAVMTLAMIQSERWRLLDLGAEINQEHVVIQWCSRRRLLRNCSTAIIFQCIWQTMRKMWMARDTSRSSEVTCRCVKSLSFCTAGALIYHWMSVYTAVWDITGIIPIVLAGVYFQKCMWLGNNVHGIFSSTRCQLQHLNVVVKLTILDYFYLTSTVVLLTITVILLFFLQ